MSSCPVASTPTSEGQFHPSCRPLFASTWEHSSIVNVVETRDVYSGCCSRTKHYFHHRFMDGPAWNMDVRAPMRNGWSGMEHGCPGIDAEWMVSPPSMVTDERRLTNRIYMRPLLPDVQPTMGTKRPLPVNEATPPHKKPSLENQSLENQSDCSDCPGVGG